MELSDLNLRACSKAEAANTAAFSFGVFCISP